MDYSKFEKKMI